MKEEEPEGFTSPLGRRGSKSKTPGSSGKKSRKQRKKKAFTPEDHVSSAAAVATSSADEDVDEDEEDEIIVGANVSTDEDEDEDEDEDDVRVPLTYLALKSEHGWFHKNAPAKFSLLTNWLYFRPGATLKSGVKDEHFFFDEQSVLEFAERWCVGVDGRNGNVDEPPPTSEQIAACAATSDDEEEEEEDEEEEEEEEEEEDEEEEEEDSDEPEPIVWTWNGLKKIGWHHSSGNGLIDYYYMRPGVSKTKDGRVLLPNGKGAVLDTHYFHAEADVFDFCTVHAVDGTVRLGNLDEPVLNAQRQQQKQLKKKKAQDKNGKRERKITKRYNAKRESFDGLPPARGGHLGKAGLSAQERKELKEMEKAARAEASVKKWCDMLNVINYDSTTGY